MNNFELREQVISLNNDLRCTTGVPQGHIVLLYYDYFLLLHVCGDDHAKYSLSDSALSPRCILYCLFYHQISAEDIGTYTGIFTAAYFVGMIPSAIVWGRLADSFGRKPTMAIALICFFHFDFLCDSERDLYGCFGVLLQFQPECSDSIYSWSYRWSDSDCEGNHFRDFEREKPRSGNQFDFYRSVFRRVPSVASFNSRLVGPILCGYLSKTENIAFLEPIFPIFIQVASGRCRHP